MMMVGDGGDNDPIRKKNHELGFYKAPHIL